MQAIILDFNSKANEINEYFSFISTTTQLRGLGGSNKIIVSPVVHNVLKANLFLLLYNLVESSFKDALEQLCIKITNDNIKYKDVIPEIKKLWIHKKYKNFENCHIPNNANKSEFIMNKIDNIAEDIIKINFYTNADTKKSSEISGNIDARKIRELNEKYGAKLINSTEICANDLLTIKNKRNNLAHGDESFSICGANYTIQELEKIKKNSLQYMLFILNHIEKFINEKKYQIVV